MLIIENILKLGLIIADVLVITMTDSKVAKITGAIAIICLGISLCIGV